uniref:Uncharacterized protein n=1 Tax=Arundo donax TaxID=35708 RepID=A0A0A9TD63_ARUDO
MCRKMKLRFGS